MSDPRAFGAIIADQYPIFESQLLRLNIKTGERDSRGKPSVETDSI